MRSRLSFGMWCFLMVVRDGNESCSDPVNPTSGRLTGTHDQAGDQLS